MLISAVATPDGAVATISAPYGIDFKRLRLIHFGEYPQAEKNPVLHALGKALGLIGPLVGPLAVADWLEHWYWTFWCIDSRYIPTHFSDADGGNLACLLLFLLRDHIVIATELSQKEFNATPLQGFPNVLFGYGTAMRANQLPALPVFGHMPYDFESAVARAAHLFPINSRIVACGPNLDHNCLLTVSKLIVAEGDNSINFFLLTHYTVYMAMINQRAHGPSLTIDHICHTCITLYKSFFLRNTATYQ